MFRSRPVGVVDQRGACPAFRYTLPQYVPALATELLDWVTKTSEVHMLIRSCVFHYELELIHPFSLMEMGVWGDCGIPCCFRNGIRPLPGCRWSPSFTTGSRSITRPSTPPMTLGNPRCLSSSCSQPSKHHSSMSINTSDGMSDGAMDKATLRWNQIEEYLETHDFIMNADVRALCGVSAATANRILASIVADGKLVKRYECGHWVYKLTYIN